MLGREEKTRKEGSGGRLACTACRPGELDVQTWCRRAGHEGTGRLRDRGMHSACHAGDVAIAGERTKNYCKWALRERSLPRAGVCAAFMQGKG